MAKTAFTTTSAETKKLWEEKFFRDSIKESFFSKFEGEDPGNVVQVKRQLAKVQGDQVYFFIRYTPTNNGVGPGTAMEGNEDKLLTASNSVRPGNNPRNFLPNLPTRTSSTSPKRRSRP